MKKKILLSFDVEEWYHTSFMDAYIHPDLFNVKRLKHNIVTPLEILAKHNVSATFFVLADVLKDYPKIITDILNVNKNHEIASHSFHHDLIFEQDKNRNKVNIFDSKKQLEDAGGISIKGFRAPYFSIDDNAFEMLNEAGYDYDSSLHDFRLNKQYGHITLPMEALPQPGLFKYKNLTEVTIPVKRYFKKLKFPFGGGGYFRLYPLRLQLHWIKSFLKTSDYFLMYMHPWEFDPEQPYIKEAPFIHRQRHYLGIGKQAQKVDTLITKLKADGYEFSTIADYLADQA